MCSVSFLCVLGIKNRNVTIKLLMCCIIIFEKDIYNFIQLNLVIESEKMYFLNCILTVNDMM